MLHELRALRVPLAILALSLPLTVVVAAATRDLRPALITGTSFAALILAFIHLQLARRHAAQREAGALLWVLLDFFTVLVVALFVGAVTNRRELVEWLLGIGVGLVLALFVRLEIKLWRIRRSQGPRHRRRRRGGSSALSQHDLPRRGQPSRHRSRS